METSSSPPGAAAPALNREIVDDRDDRLSIHTHEIRLTQAHLPYQPVAGRRPASRKHFCVHADRIVLAGVLLNPGRNIELNAREIVIERPVTLDAAGAGADQDFAPGDVPVQQDVRPGAAGTDGADGTNGGDGAAIVINALRIVNGAGGANTLSVAELAAVGRQLLADHPAKVANTIALERFEIGRTKMFGDRDMPVILEDGRIEGLARIALESVHFDAGSREVGARFELPAVSIAGLTQLSGNVASQPFACKLEAAAVVDDEGRVAAPRIALSLMSQGPIKLPILFADGTLSAAILQVIREGISKHLAGAAVAPFLTLLVASLRAAPLTLLAGGGRGGRGQDGHAGMRGESGADGARTSRSGMLVSGHFGFPEEAMGQDGHPGGRAGSPGRSGDGGKGGRIELNVVEPVALAIVHDERGGDGGAPASPGEQGPGGSGGQGAMCHMFDSSNGRRLEDMRATNGRDGPLGPVAKGAGRAGQAGAAGTPVRFNGKAYDGAVPALSMAALAQSLSLPQLLITQNATDLAFLNARDEADLGAVARGFEWLIDINRPFIGADPAIDAARVSPPEQKVRASMHDSALVSLMRLQQGLDYYGHSYNWTPILNLANLVARTGEIIQLGKVVEDQYNRYLDKASDDRQRMQAFRQAKQEIDRKLGDFTSEIDKLQPQIDNFRTEVEDGSEDLRRQRTLLVEGQLKFKDELVRYLREQSEMGLEDFLDMLGTVIGCVGGVVGSVGGIKTAIDAVKKAGEFDQQVKGVVEIFKKAKATIDDIGKAYSTVKDAIDQANPNAAKILVDADELDKTLKKYLGKFDAAGELRKAIDRFRELAQARNMAAYNYSTLVAQLLSVRMQRDQLARSIDHIDAEIAAHQDNVLPVYTAYLKDAYEDVQRNLLRNIYQENRAYRYWALKDRQLRTDDLTIATQAAAHERLIADIDAFRENNDAFSDFRQKVIVSAERYPAEFAAMRQSRSLAFTLDIRGEPGFANMRYVVARSFKLEFPDIVGGANVLFLNLIHSGQAVLNSDTDLDKPGAIHAFSHRPRVRLYKIDYKDRDNTAGGNLGERDQGYIGLSPFTRWRIDFDLKGNEWLDLGVIRTVVLTFEGRTLGPGRKLT